MSSVSFQCPDSGLVVHVSSTGDVTGDPDDWAQMGASPDAIANTRAWLVKFGRCLRQSIAARGRTFAAFADALRYCGGVVSDLDPLTRERGALDDGDGWCKCAAPTADAGEVCHRCNGEVE